MTQQELAKKSAVSQSLIAKIESGRIDPTYSKVVQIFGALNSESKQSELKARDIMNKKIISITSDMTVKDAVHLMRKHEISQMHVSSERNIV
jgi:predicted transcriptional regulator